MSKGEHTPGSVPDEPKDEATPAGERPEARAEDSSEHRTKDLLEERLREEVAPQLEVLRRLGSGSMAIVYLAREPELKRLVAVKVLSPKLARDERARLRFEREAQASAALSHPNIVAVHRVGRLSDGLPYIVMQYVKGRTMAERLRAQGPLSVDAARRALLDVGSAMKAAHQKRIVHRDIRPGNVLYEEETGRTLLADFGIAAILASGESSAPTRLTKTGELIGDPSHMSPEQLLGENVTERSDVYALGILGYELLTGRGPYDANSKREVISAHIQQEPRRLSQLMPGVDPPLEDLLSRCLAKDPGHRPGAGDVVRKLQETPTTGETTVPPSVRAPAQASLFGRIMERRLPQIVAAYGAVGWAFLSVMDQLADRDVVPEIGYKLALVAVITGLPAIVTGAWFHGQRGEQKFQRLEYWVFTGLGIVWLAVSVYILIRWLS